MISAFAAFLISWMLNHMLAGVRSSSPLAVLDIPNERSMHRKPIPRTGGLGILGAMLPLFVWTAARSFYPAPLILLALGVLLVGAVSFWDDRTGTPVGLRLAVQAIAAILMFGAGFRVPPIGALAALPEWARLALSLAVFLWGINLYNFMDGMDGLAGGMGVIGFATLALFGGRIGYEPFFVVNAIIAMAALGFLAFNFPPARLFMGDVGSASLGLLMVANSLWGLRAGCYPPWVPLVIFSPFIVDASVTLLRRIVRREPVWRAHKTHYYQRLVGLGWSHQKTLLCEYALMVFASLSAWFGAMRPPVAQLGILTAWIVVYLLLAGAVPWLEWRKSRRERR
ncbi:MAG: MraY family glycosyltransferase [Acidiferrobacteraceae bacterium]|jgi:UDP-N-acetylmuramyl pentapeptide phosphotransferase/UDP-N-acetylglucosamine-1-phosphate transferase